MGVFKLMYWFLFQDDVILNLLNYFLVPDWFVTFLFGTLGLKV